MGKNIQNKLIEMLELPKEINADVPYLSLMGNEEMVIENYKSILEYNENTIRVNTTKGVVKIEGRNLQLKEVTNEDIRINGIMTRIELG